MNDLDTIKNFGPYMVKIMSLIGIHSRDFIQLKWGYKGRVGMRLQIMKRRKSKEF
jgi:hypothetical protein